MPRYLNPYTDFGFKKLFGEEASRDLLTDFLNQLLPSQHQIASLTLTNAEQLPDQPMERRAIFDLHCISHSGERFIVEMQKARLRYFKDRALFYTTFPIREQAQRGEWDFRLTPIYFIAILDFEYDEQEEARRFRRDVALRDQYGDLFFDKLHFRFLQMPLFNKTEDELESRFDKWCYFLKHLEDMDQIPAILKEPIFEKAFRIAELASLTPQQHRAYEQNLLDYWGSKAALDTAKEEGKLEGKLEVARQLHAMGMEMARIAAATGLDEATLRLRLGEKEGYRP